MFMQICDLRIFKMGRIKFNYLIRYISLKMAYFYTKLGYLHLGHMLF